MKTLEQIRAELDAAHPGITTAKAGETAPMSEAERSKMLDEWAQAAFDRQTPAVPGSVSMRQLRLWLHSQGLLAAVDAAVSAIGGAAQIEWEYATAIERQNPLVLQLASALGLDSAAVDQAFITATTL
jgi:hypothetical protein